MHVMQGRGWMLQEAWILLSVFFVMLAPGLQLLGPLHCHSAILVMLAFILLLELHHALLATLAHGLQS